MKQISSEITTWLEEVSSKVGTQRGGRGLATPESSLQIAAWLGRQAVRDMDRAAVSRALSHNVALEVKFEGRYPTGPNGERLPSYQVAVGCDINGTDEDRKAALADLINFQTPPEIRQVEDWLAELSVISASRAREGMESALMINAYSSRLMEYPADIVRDALLKTAWKWFPSWDELEKHCEAKAGPRRQMIAALQRPAPMAEAKRRAPTQAERDSIQAMIDEKFPSYSEEMRKAAVDEVLKGECMNEGAA